MLTVFRWKILGAVVLLTACQSQGPEQGEAPASLQTVAFAAASAWGGALQCEPAMCWLGVIEHEANKVALHEIRGRSVRRVADYPVAYHPDGAAWLAPGLLAAAVEMSRSVDIFRWDGAQLVRKAQIHVDFAPRDVMLMSAKQGEYRLLATPYSGSGVAEITWREEGGVDAQVTPHTWCKTPWHPVRAASLPREMGAGVAVACREEGVVIAVPDKTMQPVVLARFKSPARRVALSPSGQWLYVALELGEVNARIDLHTGELQELASSQQGSYAPASLADDTIAWAQSDRLLLQKVDARGKILESRVLAVPGFNTTLLVEDLDGDGEPDAIVLNAGGNQSAVIYGPLWANAIPVPAAPHSN